MIPYIHVDPIHLGPLTLQPFGLLVATGVLVGSALATRRAERLGLDVEALRSFIGWVVGLGFVGAHVFDTIFYHPEEIVARPWSLLFLWEGLSSFGGFLGAAIGAFLWRRYHFVHVAKIGPFQLSRPKRREEPASILAFADVILAVFPVAWIFGRAGCAVVHDHPGAFTSKSALLAVAYGPGPVKDYGFFELRWGSTPRYDLGFLEMLFTILVAIGFAATWRKKLPLGTYVAASALVYAPVRFALDFLRAPAAGGGDIRWAGLTFAQWACVALFAFGLAMARKASRTKPEEPVTPRDSAGHASPRAV